jgi:uncharacterized membrane protein
MKSGQHLTDKHVERTLCSRYTQASVSTQVRTSMGNPKIAAVVVAVMVVVIVAVDLLFFKNRLWERLAANVGIVLVFGAFYFRFLRHP